MDRIKAGVAGAGRHGSRYIDHILNDIEGIELSAIARYDPDRGLERRWKGKDITLFHDIDDIISSGIDLLIIATPTDTHHSIARKALENNIHVLLEKPMCGNSSLCRELMKIERSSAGTLTVAQTLRFSPSVLEMERILEKEGPIRWFEMVNALEQPKTNWLMEERAMGGCVLNTGVHVFDLINHLLGPIISASCWTERIFNPVWEDYAYGNLTISDGIEGSFRISRNTNLRTRYIRVDLQEGFIWADTVSDMIYTVKDGKMKKRKIKGERFTLIPLLNRMVDVVKGNSEPPVNSKDGLKAVEVAEACYSSVKEDREIRLKSE